jgi:hypothetical protein
MSSSHPRSEERPDGRVPIVLTKVPKEGFIVVRFLGEISGLLMHFRKKPGPLYCRGHECPTSIHGKLRAEWRGYAAVQLWRDDKHQDWVPTVVELTTHFWGLIHDQELRGQSWQLFREVNERGKLQVVGRKLDAIAERSLPNPHPILPCLWRIYGTKDIELGQEPAIPPAELVEPVKGSRPPLPTRRRKVEEPIADPAEVRRIISEGKARLGLPIESNGKH